MKTKICSKCKIRKYLIKFDSYYDKRSSFPHLRYHSYCKQCRNLYNKIYTKNNKAKIKNLKRQYNKKYKLKNSLRWKKYYEQHKSQIKKYREIKRKELNYRLLNNLRCRIWVALKKNIKSQNTINLLGCTIPKLKKHLQSQFKKGMTWKNYGKNGWHIDHIKPCYEFNLSKTYEQLQCFNYKNLQPLWAKDNLTKSNKRK